MTQEHPITPSLELVDHWFDGDEYDLATKAARWGAAEECAGLPDGSDCTNLLTEIASELEAQ